MPEYRSSLEVARLLGVPEWMLDKAIRRGDIAPPPKIGGVRVWPPDLVANLRAALAARGTPTAAMDAVAAGNGSERGR